MISFSFSQRKNLIYNIFKIVLKIGNDPNPKEKPAHRLQFFRILKKFLYWWPFQYQKNPQYLWQFRNFPWFFFFNKQANFPVKIHFWWTRYEEFLGRFLPEFLWFETVWFFHDANKAFFGVQTNVLSSWWNMIVFEL